MYLQLTSCFWACLILSDKARSQPLAREDKREKYHSTVDLLFDWFGISCMTTDNFWFYLQNRLIQTRRSTVQWYFPLKYSLLWPFNECLGLIRPPPSKNTLAYFAASPLTKKKAFIWDVHLSSDSVFKFPPHQFFLHRHVVEVGSLPHLCSGLVEGLRLAVVVGAWTGRRRLRVGPLQGNRFVSFRRFADLLSRLFNFFLSSLITHLHVSLISH
jgi:hypothetical protein